MALSGIIQLLLHHEIAVLHRLPERCFVIFLLFLDIFTIQKLLRLLQVGFEALLKQKITNDPANFKTGQGIMLFEAQIMCMLFVAPSCISKLYIRNEVSP